MCDEWMPELTFPLSREAFRQLPRNAAYQYDHADDAARISPHPRTMHAMLDLTRFQAKPEDLAPAQDYELVPFLDSPSLADGSPLVALFADAFDRVQPFAGLDVVERQVAARLSLERSLQGGDGPWVGDASFGCRWQTDSSLRGVILITLLPEGDPADPETYAWPEPPPADAWQRTLGQPHLTWIFTDPQHKGHGVGTRLLAEAVPVLRNKGYRRLLTTFILGNDSSLLWHWRNGFELLPYIASKRMRKRLGLMP